MTEPNNLQLAELDAEAPAAAEARPQNAKPGQPHRLLRPVPDPLPP